MFLCFQLGDLEAEVPDVAKAKVKVKDAVKVTKDAKDKKEKKPKKASSCDKKAEKPKKPSKSEKKLEKIKKQLAKLTGLKNDLVAKIKAGRVEVDASSKVTVP